MPLLGVHLLSAGDSVFVGGVLREMGIHGAIIMVLMGVITLMGAAIALMYRQSNKVYGYRLAERDDVLNAALNDSKNALTAMLSATKERNEITDELQEVIGKQAAAFDALAERIRMHYERLVDDNARMNMVVSAISEAVRTLVGVSTDTRNKADLLARSLDEVKAVINRPRSRTR